MSKDWKFNPIPSGCCHVILIYGLIPPNAGKNRFRHFTLIHNKFGNTQGIGRPV